MKILLTGSNGMIGRRIYENLSLIHHVIRVDMYNADYNIDICDYDNFKEIINKENEFDVIVHCAAKISFERYDMDLINSNICGTLNLIRLSEEMNCKYFLLLSSIPIIGDTINQTISINTKENPKTLYHITKLTSEYIVNLSSNQMKVGILRIASPVDVYMPNSRMIPQFVNLSKNNKDIKINGIGKRIQTYINTKDIANCIRIMINNTVTGLCILDGEIYSNYEIAKMCISLTNSKSKIITDKCEIAEDNEKWIISNKFRVETLHYKLNFLLPELIQEMIDK